MNKNFTTEECCKWNKNKLINPKTNRNIKENSALYNNIKLICSKTTKKDIYSIFTDFCERYKIKSSDILNSNDKNIYKKFLHFCNSIKEDLKKKTKDKSLNSSSNKNDLKTDLKKHKRKDEKKDKREDISSSSSSNKNQDLKTDLKKNKRKDEKKDKRKDKRKDERHDKSSSSSSKNLDLKKHKRKDERHDKSSSSSFKTQDLLINKFEYYNKIIKYLKDINFKSKNCITLTSHNNKYLLTDNIKLYKQIGTKSVFGIVYKAKNINKSYKSIPKFVVKIQLQTKEFKNELSIFKIFSSYAFKNNIIHIPLYYYDCLCNNIIKEPAYPKLLAEAKKLYKFYSIILYERADGDLKSFITSRNYNENIWKNIYEQIYMSIFIIHNLGYLHNDAHSGNFIYRKIKKRGCFHYKINGEDYYIENLGYIWMIWDYGNTRDAKLQASYAMLEDYYRINTFLCHRNIELEATKAFNNNIIVMFLDKEPTGHLDDKIHIPSSIKYIQNKLFEKFININPDKYLTIKAQEKKINDKSFIKLLKDENLLFSKTPIGEVIYSTTI
jgi:hypothetical protein